MRLLKNIVACCMLVGIHTIALAQNNDAAAGQHQQLGMAADKGEGKMNPDPRAAWFPKAGLGLFIHWGAIAGYGGGDLSWCMLANKSWLSDGTVTPNFYYGLMDKWNPQQWDPDALLKQAKAAGFQYAVFVTKHHDGYTMWPSKFGDLGTQTKMKSRDFVKPFVDACRKYGLKVGLYYSPPDWWFDRLYRSWGSGKNLGMNHEPLASRPVKPAGHDKRRVEMVANQVRELLNNYGKIDMMFFDGGAGEITNDEIRKIQPGIVINRRNKAPGDYADSEGILPEKRFVGWFETNDPVWPDKRWSYSTSDIYNDAATVLSNLIKVRAWGGNYLANIGPEGSGHIPEPATAAMREMEAWMRHSKESVIDVTGGNYPEASTVPVTERKSSNVWYAFAMPAYQGYIKVETTGNPKKVILLRTGQSLEFKREDNKIVINLPPKDRTRMPDAMKIIF